VFVDRVGLSGLAKTHVYEVDHLTTVLPFLKT